MANEPRDGGADIEAVFEAGQSGPYPAPYLTTLELFELSALCLGAGHVICNIEAFEIAGEFDVMRSDLSLYGETSEQILEPWPTRAEDSHTFVSALVEDARKEINPIMFSVWMDRPD